MIAQFALRLICGMSLMWAIMPRRQVTSGFFRIQMLVVMGLGVLATLTEYRKAMEARSVDRLAAVVDPELTVIEGIHKNAGWPDYRDNHIGPEMKDWKAFQVLDPLISEVTVSGDHAYALQQATYTITTAKDTVVLDGVESFVLRKSSDTWKIKLVHFSAKRREKKEK